jgi:hypothetical protein
MTFLDEPWDSTVVITAITTVGTVLTGIVTVIANITAKKVGQLQEETESQTATLSAHGTVLSGAATRDEVESVRAELQALRNRNTDAVKLLITSREDITAIRGELVVMHAQGTDAGIKLAAQLTAEMSLLRRQIQSLRGDQP